MNLMDCISKQIMNHPKGLTVYVLLCESFRVELQTTHDLTNTENRKYTVYSKTVRLDLSKKKETV